MVVAVEARKFSLPYLSLSSPKVTSFLYDPNSLSLALMHSDSTFSLFPSFSPFSISNLPPPQTLIPPPSSSACFVPLNSNPNPKIIDGVLAEDDKRVVFVTAGPCNGGSRVVLRFHLLGFDGKFVKVPKVVCSQNGVCFDRKLGVIVDVSHGMKVMISGSINYLALYSASGGKILVFGVKLIEDGRSLRLVKCAVIDCRFPISSICLSFGYMILGEMSGVRVFPLRVLVKGRVGIRRRPRVARGKGGNSNAEHREVSVKAEGQNSNVLNGSMKNFDDRHEIETGVGISSLSNTLPNGHAYSVPDGVSSSSHANGTVKPRSLKFCQDSGDWGMQFVLFSDYVLEGVNSKFVQCTKTKAISIQAVSQEKFLILDSSGVVHVLQVSKSGFSRMRQLTCTVQVQRLAAFPDASADSQTIWISDGLYSVHVMAIPGLNTIEKENDCSSNEGEIILSSVTQAIFTSENIQDMVPLDANRVLVLGQDSVCAYGIS